MNSHIDMVSHHSVTFSNGRYQNNIFVCLHNKANEEECYQVHLYIHCGVMVCPQGGYSGILVTVMCE